MTPHLRDALWWEAYWYCLFSMVATQVDAEQERGLTERFDVSGFPTLRLFPR